MAENGQVTVTILRNADEIPEAIKQERFELLCSFDTVRLRKAAAYFLRISGQHEIVQRLVDQDHSDALAADNTLAAMAYTARNYRHHPAGMRQLLAGLHMTGLGWVAETFMDRQHAEALEEDQRHAVCSEALANMRAEEN